VKLRWDYATDGLTENINSELCEVKVMGIEMVYVPEGSFYVGSGGSENRHFYTAGTTNSPYLINSEDPITLGTTSGNLAWGSTTPAGTVPAAFPKGYNAFYCMKYEITQEQYCDFLNKLTATQKANRIYNEFNSSRNYIKLVNGLYGCDGNDNGILNEADDGQNIACNFLSWGDGAAYSDWSGLSPMTELEFEKACRGPLTPVANEFAWGDTTIVRAASLVNPRTANEATLPSNANCLFSSARMGFYGPARVGNFATPGTDRTQSGASYYGIMDLSDNLYESFITIGNATGRVFTGINGDGVLDASGDANVPTHPDTQGDGTGIRGGSWYDSPALGRVSERMLATSNDPGGFEDSGFRCCIRGVNP
jgi:formylglycine-generating enzyme required for sulfatase activity